MKLVHFPEAPDPRYAFFLDVPEEGCIYRLEDGVLLQQLRFRDGRLEEASAVSSDGVEEEAEPFFREVEALLHNAEERFARVEEKHATYKTAD